MKKDRGILLTVLLFLGVLGVVVSLFTLFNTKMVSQSYGSLPSWYFAYAFIGIIFGLLNMYGIWKWKKWVIYTFATSSIISVIMHAFVLKPVKSSAGPLPVIISLLSAGLWFYAIYRKWKYFE